MFSPEILVLEFFKVGEHRAVVHMMTVDHYIVRGLYVILSGVSGRFLSDHSATSSGCTSDKILLILNPLLPLRLASLYWESVDWYSLRRGE